MLWNSTMKRSQYHFEQETLMCDGGSYNQIYTTSFRLCIHCTHSCESGWRHFHINKHYFIRNLFFLLCKVIFSSRQPWLTQQRHKSNNKPRFFHTPNTYVSGTLKSFQKDGVFFKCFLSSAKSIERIKVLKRGFWSVRVNDSK